MESYKTEVGAKRFIREWTDGKLPPEMMQPVQVVKQVFIGEFLRELRNNPRPSIRIWIGHDYGIMLVRELMLGVRFESMPWIGYLDGGVLTYDESSLTAVWGDRTSKIAL